MNDLHGALVALADRGTPAGSQLLRERVAVDLAAGGGRRLLPSPPPRGLRTAIAAAIAVIVILGGAVLVSILVSDDTTVVTEPPPVTTVPPPTSVPPAPDPIPGFTPGAWGRVGADVMQPVVGLFDMAIVGDRFVAIGFDPGENLRQDGVIFTSDDGVTWSRLAADDPALTLGAVLMYGVTEGGPGIVAVGMGCEDEESPCSPYMTAWSSADGTSWTRSAYVPEVVGDTETQSSAAFAATATADGLVVAVGNIEDWVITNEDEVDSITARPAVWTSTDGIDWERSWEGVGVELTLEQYSEAEAGATMQGMVIRDDGLLVAVGQSTNGGVGVAAVWTSTSGVSWERVAHDPAVFAGPDETPARMFDIAAGDSGFVAVGNAGGHPAAWTSPDGSTWQRIDDIDSDFDGSMSSVAALGPGFVAAGPHGFADMNEAPVTLWTSPDGSSWDRVQVLDYGYTQAILATPQGIAVAGGLPEDNDFHASVWVGEVFDPATPPPVPLLPEVPPEAEPEDDSGLDAGLGCDDFTALGYSFAKAVASWERNGRPPAMDEDGNGVPCESSYHAAEIELVFGSSDALDVAFVSDLPVNRFEATGAAVDAGLVCPAGTQEFVGEAPTRNPQARWRWEDRYTCDDGSGSFVIGSDVFFESGNRLFGTFDIGSGTGSYAGLWAGGGASGVFDVSDTLVGRAEIVAGIREPLHADGDVGCLGADVAGDVVGSVTLQPTAEGVAFEVVLTRAAADREYFVELSQPRSGDDCLSDIQSFVGLTTDGSGNGVLAGTYEAPSGTYLLLVNMVTELVPEDFSLREIATSRFIEITVP